MTLIGKMISLPEVSRLYGLSSAYEYYVHQMHAIKDKFIPLGNEQYMSYDGAPMLIVDEINSHIYGTVHIAIYENFYIPLCLKKGKYVIYE